MVEIIEKMILREKSKENMILREIFLEFIIDKKEYNINEKDTLKRT